MTVENPKIENFSESQEILNAISEFIIMLKCHKKLTLNGMILTQSEKEKIILSPEGFIIPLVFLFPTIFS